MEMRHFENLLRRYKDKSITIKTISGGVYEGRVSEVTNNYVGLRTSGGDGESREQVFLLYQSIESVLPESGE